MANEYLKRTPTSTGNLRVFTWSGWIKYADPGASAALFGAYYGDNSRYSLFRRQGGYFQFFGGDYTTNPTSTTTNTNTWDYAYRRDTGSWMHVMYVQDTTKLNGSERTKIYVNGEERSTTDVNTPALNSLGFINSTNTHYISQWTDPSIATQFHEGEMFDVFLVDGQALTPDVFGFYKEGKGYISVGSTQATDFRPGQWVPKAPRTIKTEINRRGGFGVNGFYLPMNDSSNFGADFHTTPNSIITLKGEDLPQPRNGAPTTTDAYVSQLRTDPYAANLVLAVPGISVGTTNLVSNGDFSNGTTGWTISDAAEGSMAVVNGQLVLTNNDTVNPPVYAWQEISTTSGKTYTLQVDIVGGTSSSHAVYVNDSSSFGFTYGSVTGNSGNGTKSHTFVASGTSVFVLCRVNANLAATSIFDNVIIKEELARDYSADIKGSGTNKTLTPNGNAGIEYVVPSYYGSALSFDGTGDYFTIPDSDDFNMGTGDFTLECWINSTDDSDFQGIFGSYDYDNAAVLFQISNTGLLRFVNPTAISPVGSSDLQTGQWNHIVMERYNGRLYGYVNGVAEINIAYTSSVDWGHSNNSVVIGVTDRTDYPGQYEYKGLIQDLRLYKGVAKYKGGFDVPKPYTPVGIGTWRAVPDTTANNFATWNPLFNGISNLSFSDGNLTLTESSSSTSQVTGTIEVSSGKWYYESYVGANPFNGSVLLGIGPATRPLTNVQNRTVYRSNGDVYTDSGTTAQSGTTYTTGNIIGIAFDVDAKKLWFSKNGSWVYSGEPSTGGNTAVTLTLDAYSPFTAFDGGAGTAIIKSNFGQNPTFSGNTTAGTYTDSNGKGLFKYQPPTGFLALCEDNLPTPAIADPGKHFKTVLYEGDGNNGRSITGLGFKPDLVWIKSRNASGAHQLMDSVRGAGRQMYPNLNYVEAAGFYQSSFDEDGFTINYNSSGATNQDGRTYVAWCWKAGGAAVSNTDGSITSQVSAKQDAGFSIATWTGTGTGSQTIGHGLGKAPDFYIWKSRDNAREWHIAHKGLTAYNYTLYFTTAGEVNNDKIYQAPSSTLIYPASSNTINGLNEKYVGYFWTEIEGFSKFGSYTANANADGPFVYCGFKPAWVMVKNISTSATNWEIIDNVRGSSNGSNGYLIPNDPIIEYYTEAMDLLSNGFKIRTTSAGWNSASGNTYIFAAFAESAFSYSNAK